MFNMFINSAIRHAITSAGTFLVTAGALSSAQQPQFIQIAGGIAIYLVGQMMSMKNAATPK
jgi:hypothetical protein